MTSPTPPILGRVMLAFEGERLPRRIAALAEEALERGNLVRSWVWQHCHYCTVWI